MDAVDVPIACSLTADDVVTRMAEWRTFLAESVVSARRDDRGLHLLLVQSDDVLLAAADLAAREKACCPFFSMSIQIEPAARTLTLDAPPDAAGVLDEFMGLLPAPRT